jgi:hypothetical protein
MTIAKPAGKEAHKPSVMVHIKATLVWKWSRTKSGNYIALCDLIAQTVQAPTFSELLETIKEAICSTFRELFSSGDLATFMREHGWTSSDMPARNVKGDIRFDVPFDLKGVPNRDLEEAICC